jgi:LuxR family maltose regulon positive regulatory protein
MLVEQVIDGPSRSVTGFIGRRRVSAQLDSAVRSPVTLVNAPAGWGKSVALREWACSRSPALPTVWLTADRPNGRELLRTVLIGLTGGEDPENVSLDGLGAAIAALDRPVVVVMDEIPDAPDPLAASVVEHLLRHANDRLRLVLACRAEPALNLHRRRVDGTLAEIGQGTLAFTVDEWARLLAQGGFVPGPELLIELHALTGGWPVGLRAAATQLRHAEPERVMAELGTDPAVAGYLRVEVVDRLPSDARKLLLETSVCDRLTGDLVCALTDSTDGASRLSEVARGGAFVSRCAGWGDWYHVHPLLHRHLYRELQETQPLSALDLHGRAADWFAQRGMPGDSIRQALLGGRTQHAVDVLKRSWPHVVLARHQRGVVPARPATEPVPVDPHVSLAFAAERLDVSDVDGATGFLTFAERGGHTAGPAGSMLTAFHLARARIDGDLPAVLREGTRLVNSASSLDPVRADEVRALAMTAMGAAHLQLGRLPAADLHLREGLVLGQRTGLAHTQLTATSQIAVLEAMRGRLRAAVRAGHHALALAGRLGLTRSCELAWASLALAEAHYQWNRIETARRLLDQALDQAHGEPSVVVAGAVLRARLHLAQGDPASGSEVLTTVRRLASDARVPTAVVRARALAEAELRVVVGDVTAAWRLLTRWTAEEPFPDWAAVARARVLLAEGKPSAAAAVVAPYLGAVNRTTSVTWRIHAGLVTALAGHASNDRRAVTRGLESALADADAEGFRRPFLDGGHVVREMLDTVAPTMPVYGPVVAALAGEVPGFLAAPSPVSLPRRIGGLVEPLTDRELTVLRYLQGTLSNAEIADMLYVSINTVKSHVKTLYRKLNTGRRRDAVRRARELGLI